MKRSGVGLRPVGFAVLVIALMADAFLIFTPPPLTKSATSHSASDSISSSSLTDTSQTLSSSSQAASQIMLEVSEWGQAIDNANMSEQVESFYVSNSTLQVSGNVSTSITSIWDIGGTWNSSDTGSENIGRLYYQTTDQYPSSPSAATITNLSVSYSGEECTATFHLLLRLSGGAPAANASIDVKQVWVSQGGGWRIQKEYWNFLNYSGGFRFVTEGPHFVRTQDGFGDG